MRVWSLSDTDLSVVSSPDAPPTGGKECLVAIDAKLGPMTSLSFHTSGCGLGTSQAMIGQSQAVL